MQFTATTELGHPNQVNSVSFSPDDKLLLSGGKDAGVMLWNLDLDDLMLQGCSRVTDYLQNNVNINQGDRSICNLSKIPDFFEKSGILAYHFHKICI
ncbi:hypothetical protein VB735_03075 [Halotia wernerae UHCC 0503]|nr:hypothetical protein [Halotia wernerae UHCC 0503]